MNWEALTALSTAFTGLVILFTVLVGWHQVRAAAEQGLQAHRATQLDGMMRIFAQFDDPKFLAARKYIVEQLHLELEQPEFDGRFGNAMEQPWFPALSTLERMGVFIKMGLLDAEPFYYHYGFPIIRITGCLQPLIERHRRVADNPFLWKDTEALGREAREWGAAFILRERRVRPSTGEIYKLDFFDPPPA